MNTRQTLEVLTLLVVAASAAATEVLYAQAHLDALRAPVRAVIFDFFALTLLGGIAGIVWLIVWLNKKEAS